jgi:hypothetical protein
MSLRAMKVLTEARNDWSSADAAPHQFRTGTTWPAKWASRTIRRVSPVSFLPWANVLYGTWVHGDHAPCTTSSLSGAATRKFCRPSYRVAPGRT